MEINWSHDFVLTFSRPVDQEERQAFIDALDVLAIKYSPNLQFAVEKNRKAVHISACLPNNELEHILLPYIEERMFADTHWLTTREEEGPLVRILSVKDSVLCEHDVLPIPGREIGVWRSVEGGFEYIAMGAQVPSLDPSASLLVKV